MNLTVNQENSMKVELIGILNSVIQGRPSRRQVLKPSGNWKITSADGVSVLSIGVLTTKTRLIQEERTWWECIKLWRLRRYNIKEEYEVEWFIDEDHVEVVTTYDNTCSGEQHEL